MAAATAVAGATAPLDDQQSPEYEELPAPWSIPPIVSFDPGSVKGPKQFLSVVHAEEKVPFSSNSRKCELTILYILDGYDPFSCDDFMLSM